MHDAAQSHHSSAKAHRPSTPTVFGAAFVAGAVAAFGINSFFDAHVARTRPQVESEPIFVALRSLPQGAPVTVWDVGLRAWPRAMLPETALRAEDRFEGLILRHPLREGQPLLSVQLAQPVAASGTPGEERVEEAFAAPVPAADAAPAPDSGLATIAPITPDRVEVFAPVERFEPAAPAADDLREPVTTVESIAATRVPVAEPVFEPVAQPATAAAVPPVEQPAVGAAGDLTAAGPIMPERPVITPATPSDVGETVAPLAPVVAPSETVAVPASDASVDATVPEPIVSAAPGTPFPATIGTPAAPLNTSPEAVDAPPLLPTTVADAPVGDAPVADAPVADAPVAAPADTLAEKDVEAPVETPVEGPAETSDALTADASGSGSQRGPAPNVAVVPVPGDVPLVPTPVHLLPPVDATARATPARPPVPPAPGSDIEASLATISRQRAAQIAASRPGSVIAASDPLMPEPAPVPALPSADVAVPLATIAAAHPAPRSPAPPARGGPEPVRTGVDAKATVTAPTPAPTAPADAEVVAAPVTEASRDPAPATAGADAPPAHPPLRHLVVPERIAMQAEASFVAPRPTPTDEPTAAVPTAATTPAPAKNAAAAPRAMSGQTTEPRGDRASAPATQPRPAPPSRTTGGPVMRAIGSLFQGFGSGQTATEQQSRRR